MNIGCFHDFFYGMTNFCLYLTCKLTISQYSRACSQYDIKALMACTFVDINGKKTFLAIHS